MGDAPGAPPVSRIEVGAAQTRVRVSVAGVTVADSQSAKVLTEGSLPPRYYLPPADVRMDLLARTDTSTRCPYKGVAEYWSLTVAGETHDDIVWSYPHPVPEAAGIAGLLCFYNERVAIEEG